MHSRIHSFVAGPVRVGLGLWLLAAASASAATLTNITVVNVTPSSFTILWRGSEGAPVLSVYADPQGVTNLAGQIGIELLPLHSGNPSLATDYERRQHFSQLRAKTRAAGLAQARVTGCQPNTRYYYRLTATGSGGGAIQYPATPPLPGVTTARENSFVANSQQIVVEVPGVDPEGQIITLSHPDAAYALSAVVGDGANNHQAWFNLSELMALASGDNFTPLGNQTFTVTLLGTQNQPDLAQAVSLNFTADFMVARSTSQSFGLEYFALSLSTNIVRAGQFGVMPLSLNCNVGITEIVADVAIETGRFEEMTLENLPAAVQSATFTPESPTNAILEIRAAPGQTFQGQFTLANLRYRAVSNQVSAFVPVRWKGFEVYKAGSLLMNNLFAENGRIVVLGREPLLEQAPLAASGRMLTLYGIPWTGYAIQYATNLGRLANWNTYFRAPLTNFTYNFEGVGSEINPIFYRAMQIPEEPPTLEALRTAGSAKSLLVFGKAGSQYTVQYTTNLSPVATWRPLTTYTLTNSFRYLDGLAATNPVVILRLQRN